MLVGRAPAVDLSGFNLREEQGDYQNQTGSLTVYIQGPKAPLYLGGIFFLSRSPVLNVKIKIDKLLFEY